MSKPPHSFRYILRFSLDPGYDASSRGGELLDFCAASSVDEVMLFSYAEELSPGHLTGAELDRWLSMAKPLARRLAERGIGLSLNPWTTIYQVARGRSFRYDQAFTPMLGETGYQARVTPCPLCPAWQRYLAGLFIRMAEQLNPSAIWIEDDWRLHNHEHDLDGNPMGWGGCFCTLHLQRFSKMVGRDVNREQVIQKVLAPGKPHPWRALWIDLWRQTLLEPARYIRKAVRAKTPHVRFGLMSSAPDVHSVEGRDWAMMQNAWGDKTGSLIRPHMQPYTETSAISTTPCVTRQTLANLSGPIEVYPELESSPRCGPYSKSRAYAAWQCSNAALFGSHGITINHFDVLGNGVLMDERFGEMLAREKPKLNALAALQIDDRVHSRGLRVLFHPQVATHLQTTDNSRSMNDLVQASYLWGRTAMISGIANTFTDQIVSGGMPYAVNGQTLRAYADEEINRLLSGPVLLDADAADILFERGFGDWIGVTAMRWRQQSESSFAYESILETDPSIYGHACPRMTAQRCASRMLEMTPRSDARTRSTICRYDHTGLFPGMIDYSNKHGGRVISLAYPLDGKAQFFMGFFNPYRRVMLQRLIEEMAPQAEFAHVEEHPMHVYRIALDNGVLLAAINVIADDAPSIRFRLPACDSRYRRWQLLQHDGNWSDAPIKTRYETGITTATVLENVAPLRSLVLRAIK